MQPPFVEIQAKDAYHRRADFQVVDVREPWELSSGTIPGARNIPMGEVPARVSSIGRDRPLLVVCRSGGRSARVAIELARHGFREVYNLTGGMLAWTAEGLPTESAS